MSSSHSGLQSKRKTQLIVCLFTVSLPVVLANPSAHDQPDTAGFQSSVQPSLAKNCVGCHNAKLQSGGLNLQLYSSIEAISKDHEKWQQVLEKVSSGQMPPPGMPRLLEPDKAKLIAWISAELDREDRLVKPDPGRITARRLNRTEYNNSVRDLLGVNFQAAADFPPDDTGYGFDDIGDVLSVSPSLMEKYLSAAEKVARTALYGPANLKPTLVKREPWYVDFETKPVVKTVYDQTGLSLPSALHVMHRFPVEGDYDIAGLLRGTRPDGSEPLQVAYWLDGKQVKILDYPVPPGGEVSGVRRQFRVHVPAGEHWVAASFLHIYEGLPPAYKGPNPSKLPQPKPRVVSNKQRKAVPDGADTVAAPTNNDEFAAAAAKFDIGAGQLPRFATTAFFVSNLEVIGPYNQVTGPSAESMEKIFTCGHRNGEHNASCARKILTNLAGRVYRRPATQAELTQLLGLVAEAQKNGDSLEEGLCLAIQKMLISPAFLFRIEQDRRSPECGNRPPGQRLRISNAPFLFPVEHYAGCGFVALSRCRKTASCGRVESPSHADAARPEITSSGR